MSGLRTEKADLGTAALALVALSIVVCAADWAAARGGGGADKAVAEGVCGSCRFRRLRGGDWGRFFGDSAPIFAICI